VNYLAEEKPCFYHNKPEGRRSPITPPGEENATDKHGSVVTRPPGKDSSFAAKPHLLRKVGKKKKKPLRSTDLLFAKKGEEKNIRGKKGKKGKTG